MFVFIVKHISIIDMVWTIFKLLLIYKQYLRIWCFKFDEVMDVRFSINTIITIAISCLE